MIPHLKLKSNPDPNNSVFNIYKLLVSAANECHHFLNWTLRVTSPLIFYLGGGRFFDSHLESKAGEIPKFHIWGGVLCVVDSESKTVEIKKSFILWGRGERSLIFIPNSKLMKSQSSIFSGVGVFCCLSRVQNR